MKISLSMTIVAIFWSDGNDNYLYWNDGNYIIGVFGNISKSTLVELAKSTKTSKTIEST